VDGSASGGSTPSPSPSPAAVPSGEPTVASITVSPDTATLGAGASRNFLASYTWGSVAGSGHPSLSWRATGGSVQLTWVPSGDWVAASTSRFTRLTLWPLRRPYPRIVEGYSGLIRPVAFSPDGKYIALCQNKKTTILERKNDNWVDKQTLTYKFTKPLSVAFSPDSNYIAVGLFGAIQIFRKTDNEWQHEKSMGYFGRLMSPPTQRYAPVAWFPVSNPESIKKDLTVKKPEGLKTIVKKN